jgi:ATP-dependent helicase/nuclease subunit B
VAVRFVIGRAGTGKSRRCFDAITDACASDPLGPPIYWILPKQATFTAERELTCNSGLQGFSRARVVSFEELGRQVLAECGGVAIPQVTALGRQMVLGHLLRKHKDELRFFTSVTHQPGLAAELDTAFAEFERHGKGCDDLLALVGQLQENCLDESDAAICAKLADLHLLYDAYCNYLGQERLDPHRRLQQVLGCVERSRRLRGAQFYVDGFYDFTDYERRFLAGVAKACELLEIALTLDPNSPVLRDVHQQREELGMFHLTEQTYRQLWFAFSENDINVDETIALTKARRFQSSGLRHLESCLFARAPKASKHFDGIALIEAPDRCAEVDAVARHVQSLLAQGLRLREIAVLVRSLDGYHELIHASFHEHQLPYFVDRRRSATHHPLVQFTRALPALTLHDWDHDAVMTLLKSGLVPLGDDHLDAGDAGDAGDAADELENYVLSHRIRGSIWADPKPWTFRRELIRRDPDDEPLAAPEELAEVERMDALRRRLVDLVQPFVRVMSRARTEPVALRQIVVALLKVFEACHVRQTLARWMEQAQSEQAPEQRAEHAQVWNALADLLDQLVDLLGDEPVLAGDFVQILESGLESFDLALTPPTVDQVLVGSVDRTRTPSGIRATIVLGLHEGGFPACPREGSILGDAERRSLRDRKLIDLDPDTHRRLMDERFWGYIAFTRASEHLCLMRPLADDDDRPLAPSSFWNQIRAIFPALEPTVIPRDASHRIECIGTARQLITSLLRWARDRHDELEDQQPWANLYQHLAGHQARNDAIGTLRDRAWRALSYANSASLSQQVASALFGPPLHASVSRIETFASCPFKHFARYGLKLAEREEEDVTALDLGNVYHGILENFVRQVLAERHDFASVPETFTHSQIRACAKQVGQSLRNELMLSSARNQYLLQHVEKTVGQVVDGQRACARRGKFRPWKAELAFGMSGAKDSLPPLELSTPGGNVVKLHGKIDRVDLIEEQAAVAVIDYKLSGNALDLTRVYHGISLQLLTYLLVLQNAGQQLAGRPLTPAAAFYVKLLRKLESVPHPADATPPTDEKFNLKVKPRGIFDRRFVGALDSELESGASDVVKLYIKKDGGIGANSDAAEPEPFAALLSLVRVRIGQLADQIVEGDVRVRPYRIGTNTPCPACPYRSVCRFEPVLDGYHALMTMSRDEVIERATKEAGDA